MKQPSRVEDARAELINVGQVTYLNSVVMPDEAADEEEGDEVEDGSSASSSAVTDEDEDEDEEDEEPE